MWSNLGCWPLDKIFQRCFKGYLFAAVFCCSYDPSPPNHSLRLLCTYSLFILIVMSFSCCHLTPPSAYTETYLLSESLVFVVFRIPDSGCSRESQLSFVRRHQNRLDSTLPAGSVIVSIKAGYSVYSVWNRNGGEHVEHSHCVLISLASRSCVRWNEINVHRDNSPSLQVSRPAMNI